MKRPRYPMPPEIEKALTSRRLMAVYRERPAYQQNDYVGWIGRARRDDTREKRIGQMLDELEAGGVYMGMVHNPTRKV
jgi:uncharacterized protein YdeI (YjbR/CyaY-like superfamily)